VLGRLVEGVPVYANRPARVRALCDPAGASPRVALLATHLDDDGELLRQAVAVGFDGVVIAALGVGHVPAAVAEQVAATAPRVPVVFASRAGGGSTARSTYGFVGSESDLLARGAIAAGWLTPVKARQLLWSLLAHGLGPEDLARQFAVRGAAAPGVVA
jgi:L-asparaginase